MNKKIRKALLYVGFIGVLVAAVIMIVSAMQPKEPTIMDVIDMFENGEITECEYNIDYGQLTVVTKDKRIIKVQAIVYDFFKTEIYDVYIGTDPEAPKLPAVTPENGTVVPETGTAVPETEIVAPGTEIELNGITFNYVRAKQTPVWVTYLGLFLVIAVIIGLFVFMAKQSSNSGSGGGGARGFGRARVKNALDTKNKVYFKDVAGCDEEKEELQEVVEFLRNPDKFTKLGARIPRGVLLVGPPGTGKTLLAKAVAGEAGVPFYSISGSDFVELYVGVGASRVRDLFDTARKNPAAIIFIDEIDAVGRHRGAGLGGGHDEREQTLNQLLVEMDGFSGREGTIVMAATNRPDILDPALLRPGRFDRQVTVNYPDMKGREEILKVHSRKKPLEETVSLRKIAQMTTGMTGAELANVLNEAALIAARKGKELIGMNDIEEACLKEMVGTPKKSFKINEKEKKNTAYHEAGHAILDYVLPTQDPVRHISIIPSSKGALGYTLSHPTDDKMSVYRQELKERIAVLLGGRVAETIIFGDYSGGASNDIQRATTIARKMVTELGMSELGPIRYGSSHGSDEVFLGRDFSSAPDYSEITAAKIDTEIKKIIDEAYELAHKTLSDNIDKLHFVATFLVEYETMDDVQFKTAMESENPTLEAINALADEKRRISEEENRQKKEKDEKDRREREQYLREHDESYDETDVNKDRKDPENGDISPEGKSDNDNNGSDGEVRHLIIKK